MGARDRDPGLAPHQLPQHLGARDDRDLQPLCASTTSGLSWRTAEEITTTEAPATFSARWPSAIRRAELAQLARGIRLGEIRARHAIALVEEDLGDPAHADPADSYEMELCVLSFLYIRAVLQSARSSHLDDILSRVGPVKRRDGLFHRDRWPAGSVMKELSDHGREILALATCTWMSKKGRAGVRRKSARFFPDDCRSPSEAAPGPPRARPPRSRRGSRTPRGR